MKTVTFQTALDVARETPRAYKIVGGNYVPKSQVTVELLWEEESAPHFGAKRLIKKQIVNITMPQWLVG